MHYKGNVHKVGEHIDTDAIIPARFLVTADPVELGKHCMAGLEPDWVARVKHGDIVVSDRNFGCGSSREHAPLALLGAGIPVVIAHSFARIFYRNAINMGLLLIELGEIVDNFKDGDQVEVDTEKGVVRNLTQGGEWTYPALPPSMNELLQQGGLVPYVRARLNAKGVC